MNLNRENRARDPPRQAEYSAQWQYLTTRNGSTQQGPNPASAAIAVSNLHQSCNSQEYQGKNSKESRVSISQNVVDDPVPIRDFVFDQPIVIALLYFLILKKVCHRCSGQMHALKSIKHPQPNLEDVNSNRNSNV